ncbi:MAG TPA: sigma-70 family RNA polymerase sigma factor, partial [Acidimicrobiales bacterium]|nr:sigma-70 family RNA polymerase sigma factor [Acidimicrobiales bacterium]
ASDSALVVAIGRYHEPALAEVYRRHGGAVWAIAKRVTRSEVLADEATQDVLLRLWREPERYDASRAGLRTYLISLAHNRAVDLLRSEVARAAREARSERETANAGYDVEHHAWDLATAEQVHAAIATLPDGERDAIKLAYFEGRTYREVATILGQPEGTVKSRIRAGLKRMRASLTQHQTLIWNEQ